MGKNKELVIAIDGPAASGKSTTARMVANELNYLYIDTGAMYRALTLAVLNSQVDYKNRQAVYRVAERINIHFHQGIKGSQTFLDGNNVSDEIRLPKVTEVISKIAAYEEIREIMKKKQRALAQKGGIVMDGRDIGTVVLPNADLKIYMDAGVNERTRRRQKEMHEKGLIVEFDQIKSALVERDRLDSSRNIAPLKPATDAVVIDTSNLTINEQVHKILDIIHKIKQK